MKMLTSERVGLKIKVIVGINEEYLGMMVFLWRQQRRDENHGRKPINREGSRYETKYDSWTCCFNVSCKFDSKDSRSICTDNSEKVSMACWVVCWVVWIHVRRSYGWSDWAGEVSGGPNLSTDTMWREKQNRIWEEGNIKSRSSWKAVDKLKHEVGRWSRICWCERLAGENKLTSSIMKD
jgi:hypothetical protein